MHDSENHIDLKKKKYSNCIFNMLFSSCAKEIPVSRLSKYRFTGPRNHYTLGYRWNGVMVFLRFEKEKKTRIVNIYIYSIKRVTLYKMKKKYSQEE